MRLEAFILIINFNNLLYLEERCFPDILSLNHKVTDSKLQSHAHTDLALLL